MAAPWPLADRDVFFDDVLARVDALAAGWDAVFRALKPNGELVWEPRALLKAVSSYTAMEFDLQLKCATGLTRLRTQPARHDGLYEQGDSVTIARVDVPAGVGQVAVIARQKARAGEYRDWFAYVSAHSDAPQSRRMLERERLRAELAGGGGGGLRGGGAEPQSPGPQQVVAQQE
eukprot:gene16290-19501_t